MRVNNAETREKILAVPRSRVEGSRNRAAKLIQDTPSACIVTPWLIHPCSRPGSSR